MEYTIIHLDEFDDLSPQEQWNKIVEAVNILLAETERDRYIANGGKLN